MSRVYIQLSDEVSRRAPKKDRDREKAKGLLWIINLLPAEAMTFANRPVESEFVTIKKMQLFGLMVTVKIKGITEHLGSRPSGRY